MGSPVAAPPHSTIESVEGPGIQVSLIAASSLSDSLTFRLRWGRGARATGYLIWVRATAGLWEGLPSNLATADTFIVFTAINAAWDTATFVGVVKSTNSVGTSPDSAWLAWRVLADSTIVLPPPPPAALTLEEHIQPILTARCAGCHTGSSAPEGLDLSSPAMVLATAINVPAKQVGSDRIDRIEPFRARQDSSYLVCKIEEVCALRGSKARMPYGGPYLTAGQIDTIKAWIAAGAVTTTATMPSLAIAGGDNQQDTVLATLATPYSVVIRDQSGAPLPGIEVTWSVTGGGSVSSTRTTTNASGVASVTRTLGQTVGTHTAQAAATGVTGSPVTFTATAVAGKATVLRYDGGDNQSGPVGSTLPTPYSVLVRDKYSNPKSGVAVSWAVETGGGSISPTQGTTNASGVATATHTLGPVTGTQTATATVAGLNGSPVTFKAEAVAASSGAAVDVNDNFYSPKDVTVAPNGTVTWTWRGSDQHNVVFEDGPVSPYQNSGTYNRTFATAGTYRYRCTAHSSSFTSGMTGTVRVQ